VRSVGFLTVLLLASLMVTTQFGCSPPRTRTLDLKTDSIGTNEVAAMATLTFHLCNETMRSEGLNKALPGLLMTIPVDHLPDQPNFKLKKKLQAIGIWSMEPRLRSPEVQTKLADKLKKVCPFFGFQFASNDRTNNMFIRDFALEFPKEPRKEEQNTNLVMLMLVPTRIVLEAVEGSTSDEIKRSELTQRARRGDADAQFALGMSYLRNNAEMPSDIVEAVVWLDLAAQANSKFIEARDNIATLLTKEQREKSAQRSIQMKAEVSKTP
jgi:hypothetical protein